MVVGIGQSQEGGHVAETRADLAEIWLCLMRSDQGIPRMAKNDGLLVAKLVRSVEIGF